MHQTGVSSCPIELEKKKTSGTPDTRITKRSLTHHRSGHKKNLWTRKKLLNTLFGKKDYRQSTVTFEFNLQFMIVKWSCWNLAISPNVSIFYMTFNSVIHMPRKFTSHSLPRGQAKVMDVEVQRTHQDFPHTKTGSWQAPSSEVGLNELSLGWFCPDFSGGSCCLGAEAHQPTLGHSRSLELSRFFSLK